MREFKCFGVSFKSKGIKVNGRAGNIYFFHGTFKIHSIFRAFKCSPTYELRSSGEKDGTSMVVTAIDFIPIHLNSVAARHNARFHSNEFSLGV
jgi:hypothetical protein